MYQYTRIGPCKGSGIVSHTFKLSKGNFYISQMGLATILGNKVIWKKTAGSGYQIKSLYIQLYNIFQLISSFIIVVVKS